MSNGELSRRPDPDPTLLTTEQLLRSISSLREESKAWVDSLQLLLESKIAGKEVFYTEKFESIRTQFKERDVRTEQTASQVKLAVDAALLAQKESAGDQAKAFSTAAAKSEAAMSKQLEGLDGKITDVKDRLNRVEAMNAGMAYNRSDAHQEKQNMVSTIAAFASVAAVVISLGVAIYTVMRQSPDIHVSGPAIQPEHMISPRI
jgi:hypothetical protein